MALKTTVSKPKKPGKGVIKDKTVKKSSKKRVITAIDCSDDEELYNNKPTILSRSDKIIPEKQYVDDHEVALRDQLATDDEEPRVLVGAGEALLIEKLKKLDAAELVPVKIVQKSLLKLCKIFLEYYVPKDEDLFGQNSKRVITFEFHLNRSFPKQTGTDFKILLPHPVREISNSTLCLIAGSPILELQKKVDQEGLTMVTRLASTKEIVAECQSERFKIKLLNTFDEFVCANRELTNLVHPMGRTFRMAHKMPISVYLPRRGSEDPVGPAILEALHKTRLYMRPSTRHAIRAGSLYLDAKQLADNVETIIRALEERLEHLNKSVPDGRCKFHIVRGQLSCANGDLVLPIIENH